MYSTNYLSFLLLTILILDFANVCFCRIPIIGGKDLDLHWLFVEVASRGGIEKEFNCRVLQGFQFTPLWHQGFICDDRSYILTLCQSMHYNNMTDYVDIVKTARWEYSTRPIYGWGNVGSKQKSTAGWLAAFPVFEPHWQVTSKKAPLIETCGQLRDKVVKQHQSLKLTGSKLKIESPWLHCIPVPLFRSTV
ncbi:hypothetical protein Vadar_022855 [Vaccinium darrowii]|uniref:Uncharacterized protein n=1 Tax=Vaccinium darrowii TaxID=229202 RepID=A0ACB7YP25_9ERIC|nr:hypothetical protein Vadar_022855 [Vaccinium darrowii]